jgi:hypothetical protein
MKPLITVMLVSSLVMTAACTRDDSANVKLDGVNAAIHLYAWGDGKTKVTTSLQVGSGLTATGLDLTNDDRITAEANGVEKSLSKGLSTLGLPHYEASFDLETGGTEFVVGFFREDGSGAPTSKVTLPHPFEITRPAAKSAFKRNADVTLSWQPAGMSKDLALTYIMVCHDAAGVEDRAGSHMGNAVIDDTGVYTFAADSILNRKMQKEAAPGTTCTVRFDLIRAAVGELDPHYGGGGRITAEQIRKGTFVITL